jgi:uncharacterized protein with HEPN domain
MFNTSQKDYYCLQNMQDAIAKINEYTAEFDSADAFYADGQAFDAVLMNFIVIAEMVDKLSETLKDNTDNSIDWHRIKGFRNIIAHNYFGIDAEEVWQIIHNDLLTLHTQIDDLIGT